MSEINVIEERNGYRAVVELDEYPPAPEPYGQSPLLRIDRCTGKAEHIQVGDRPAEFDVRIEEAAERFGHGHISLLVRYLRAYHGATQVDRYVNSDWVYLTYDSAAWREYAGTPEGSQSLSDYQAWAEGEVWDFRIEKRVTWKADGHPDRHTWETDEDAGHYTWYGWCDEIETEAKAELAKFAG